MNTLDISTETYREYEYKDGTIYRIRAPKSLVIGDTTHRVVDEAGVTHCVPAPGQFGVIALRWKAVPPVSF